MSDLEGEICFLERLEVLEEPLRRCWTCKHAEHRHYIRPKRTSYWVCWREGKQAGRATSKNKVCEHWKPTRIRLLIKGTSKQEDATE